MRVDYRTMFPGGVRALIELERAVHAAIVEPGLLEPVRVRASQIDGSDLPGRADAQLTCGGA